MSVADTPAAGSVLTGGTPAADLDAHARALQASAGKHKPRDRDPVVDYLTSAPGQDRPLLDQPVEDVEPYRP